MGQNRVAQKPQLLKIIPALGNSVIIKGDEIVRNNPWHFHPEIELLFCIKAKGTNFIGNYINPIEEGEILLFGKNLPHTRQRSKDYYDKHPNEKIETIVVQFKENFLGNDFFSIKEFYRIKQLLANAQQGLKFFGEIREVISAKMHNLNKLNETSALLEVLSILDLLSKTEEFIFLNPVSYIKEVNDKDSRRINTVYSYTAQHFKEPVSLTEVAELINLTPAAFCRYFKSRTRKSYFDYLTEVRINYACELLMENKLDVSEVCFTSGFNSFSNFHKLFRRVVKLTPTEYRKKGNMKVPEFYAAAI